MDRVKARQPGGMKELKTVFSDVPNCASAKSAESLAVPSFAGYAPRGTSL